MVLSMSTDRTILWDQIQFAGEASEFAWILPVKPGATVELGSNAWLDTLDAATTPQIIPPNADCDGTASCSMSGEAVVMGCGDGGGELAPVEATPGVDVVSRESAGPYEIVILRSDSDNSLRVWLDDHGFAIPADLDPIIDDYIDEGFDFAALRLLPAAGVSQMRPVRVVQPGAVPVLPLRMVAGGAGARTPMSLFIVTEGRYEPLNFPSGSVNPGNLAYDFNTLSSNYAAERDRLLAVNDNAFWAVTYAAPGSLFKVIENPSNELPLTYRISNGWSYETFYEAYLSQAFVNGETASTYCVDALATLVTDGRRVVDPCDDEGECRAVTADEIDVRSLQCEGPLGSDVPFDDLAAALVGLHPKDVWVTRLDANLSKAAMANDLVLTPSADQSELDLFITPFRARNSPCAGRATVARSSRIGRFGTGVVLTAILAVALTRRLGRRTVVRGQA